MAGPDIYQRLLKQYWGYDSFRGIQSDIIHSIMEGHDTLGLMPTGGGKSITFQIPALASEGVCIVITPLIALMKDQVMNLRKRCIRAAALYSGLSHDQILTILENAVFGAVKLLYVSPERLTSELFRQKLTHIKVSFICVDEAHCICQWGHDFRPSYLTIADIRHQLPDDVPVLALTATATPLVVDDIQDRLLFKSKRVFRMSFERKNLSYIVNHTMNKRDELIHMLNNTQGSAIVYTRSRQQAKDFSNTLNTAGISSTFYHAGIDDAEKDVRQRQWQNDEVRVMVATNAFGMGIDKADVRLVAHLECPDSIEAYFQEAGRAGRDGNPAKAVLFYDEHNKSVMLRRTSTTFPEKEYIRQVYDHLAYFFQVGVGSGYNATFEFSIERFCTAFHHFPVRVEAALKILNRAGYIEYKEEEDCKARLRFTLERDNLYRLHNNTSEEDQIVDALLRNYSGLFTDYQFIDESVLAVETGMTTAVVYQTLRQLNNRRILHFIPQKRTPYIRYMQRREESKHLRFPPAVYDDMKKRYEERIHHMLSYVTTGNVCRSRQLLRYFGEKTHHDCGQCDVCLSDIPMPKDDFFSVKRAILLDLSQQPQYHITSLYDLPYPSEQIVAALNKLIEEEVILNDDGILSIKRL